MSEPYLGQIGIFAFDRIPSNWLPCDGRQLKIAQYTALYSLLMTTYGGDGQTYFNLPDLCGRVPTNYSAEIPRGTKYGAETVALDTDDIPAHTHTLAALASAGGAANPTDMFFAAPTGSAHLAYAAPDSSGTSVALSAVLGSGDSAAHNNVQPSLALNFCIAVFGIYPPRD